jgi:flagellar FliJ protein
MTEDNVKKELAKIRQQVRENKLKLDGLKQKEMNTIHALEKEQAQGLASDGVVAYHAYLKNLSQQISQQQKIIDNIHAQEAAKQSELYEAMKKRQILEKLKEQGVDRYHKNILKKESAFIDEIAVNQFVRSKMNSNGEEK